MLTPDYLWYVPEKAEKQAEELHNKIVSVIIERMMIRLGRGEDYLFTPIDKWQMDVLQDAGYILQAVQKEIAQTTKIGIDTIARTMKEAGIKALEWDDAVYKKAGLEPKPLGKALIYNDCCREIMKRQRERCTITLVQCRTPVTIIT